MDTAKKIQKLYAYVDESGQDAASSFFVVVAVLTESEREELRKRIALIEEQTKTGIKKWHKLSNERRIAYLSEILNAHVGHGKVYFGQYQKPIPLIFSVVDVLEKAIKDVAKGKYRAEIYIDGIDRQKTQEYTNALRVRGISLRLIKGLRDESEPLIRLADMWAGCIRGALLGDTESREVFRRAEQQKYIRDVTI
jgi:ribonuclease HII